MEQRSDTTRALFVWKESRAWGVDLRVQALSAVSTVRGCRHWGVRDSATGGSLMGLGF